MKTFTVVFALILALAVAALFVPFALATSIKLSNGLSVDGSGNLLINASGGTAYPTSLGLNLDSSGNLLVNCQSGCSGGVTGFTFTPLTTGFSIAAGTSSKTLTVSNSLTLAGTDSTTMIFPSTSVSVAGNATATAHALGLYEGTATAQNLLSCGAGTTLQGASSADPTCTATLTLGVQNTTQAILTLGGGSSAANGQLVLCISGAACNGSTITPGANAGALTFTLPVTTSTLLGSTATLTSHGALFGGGAALVTVTSNIASSAGTVFTTYNSEATGGAGMAYERGVTSQAAETTTAATVLTVTPASAVGTYRVNYDASVTSATSGVVGFTLSWTDSEGNAQSNVALSLFTPATAAPALTFTTSAAGNYGGSFVFDVNNAGSAITLKWVGGGTISAKVSAVIERLQ